MYLPLHANAYHGYSAGMVLKCALVSHLYPSKAPCVLVTWPKAQGLIPLGLNWLKMGPQGFSWKLLDPE